MIELQLLNKVLEEKSLSIIVQNDITADHFQVYKQEYEFIKQHYEQYGNIPDVTTFIDKFEDFDIVEIVESDRYLVEQIKEKYLFSKLVPFVQKTAELAEEDSRNAMSFIKEQIDVLSKLNTSFKEGTDLTKDANERYDEFIRRKNMEGLLGISTGLDELDEILHGWLPEDLVTIIARTNEGKTWLLLFFLVQAWKQGKKVLLYNGELPNSIMGFRFDTLNKHFSNSDLNKGGDNINVETYKDYIEKLKEHETPFIVVKPKDIGGRLTPEKLAGLIEIHEPDIVGIDQLTLMEDSRYSKGQGNHINYEHITEDLYLLAEKYEVPILTPHQASRGSIKSKTDEEENIPDIEHIYGADAIAHNSKRVITFKHIDKMLKIAVKKNSYGENNKELTLIWDINAGIIKPILKSEQDSQTGEVKSERVNKEGAELF